MSALAVVLMLSALSQLLLIFCLGRALSALGQARQAMCELIAAVDALLRGGSERQGGSR
jgi:hypothetical protein